MPLRPLLCVLVLAAGVVLAQEPPAPPSPAPSSAKPPSARQLELLFRESYPLEVSVSFSAALFHWLDSLAGTSGGKTIPLYLQEYVQRFGEPGSKERAILQSFRAARLRHVSKGDDPNRGSRTMLGIFLETPDFDAAAKQLRPTLEDGDFEALFTALEHFRPQYEQIWEDGRIPRAFVEGAREDPARKATEDVLARAAKFFVVDPTRIIRPRIVLVPVPAGGGTHAEAVGRDLLIEIRPGEVLADEVAPIVHENAHYLMHRMSEDLMLRFALVVRDHPAGKPAWDALQEALPTAIGQGVAAKAVSPSSWSLSSPWYHIDTIDAYAKAIYPLVQETFDAGGKIDELVLKKLLWRFPGAKNKKKHTLNSR